MIAALYARYSSDSQRAESIVAQIRAGREYCRRKGYHIIKEYADEAYTGTNDNRPAYREMLRDAAAERNCAVLLVTHDHALARKTAARTLSLAAAFPRPT